MAAATCSARRHRSAKGRQAGQEERGGACGKGRIRDRDLAQAAVDHDRPAKGRRAGQEERGGACGKADRDRDACDCHRATIDQQKADEQAKKSAAELAAKGGSATETLAQAAIRATIDQQKADEQPRRARRSTQQRADRDRTLAQAAIEPRWTSKRRRAGQEERGGACGKGRIRDKTLAGPAIRATIDQQKADEQAKKSAAELAARGGSATEALLRLPSTRDRQQKADEQAKKSAAELAAKGRSATETLAQAAIRATIDHQKPTSKPRRARRSAAKGGSATETLAGRYRSASEQREADKLAKISAEQNGKRVLRRFCSRYCCAEDYRERKLREKKCRQRSHRQPT